MNRKVVLLILIAVVFSSFLTINAASASRLMTWSTGTKIDVTVEIASINLEDGLHLVDITVELYDLSDDAIDIHDIELQYRIQGHYLSGIVNFDPIITVGNSQTLGRYFDYEKAWGIVYLEIKLECIENIPLQPDQPLVADWGNMILLYPVHDYTPPTPTPTGNGFDISEDWWVFLVGGVGLLGVGSFIAFLIMRKR